jgi:anaerobic magnesium-protoporphyrin IX monomethyl ester cyclase
MGVDKLVNFKVALINPKDKTVPAHSYGITEHLGLAYLAAYLRQNGVEVKIIDGDVEGYSDEEIIREVIQYRPQLVGITGLIRTIGDGLSIADSLRKWSKAIFICVGGQHATYAAEEILLSHSSIDCVIRGEGEITLMEVVACVNAHKSLDGVSGVYYLQEGKVIQNPDREVINDLDILPFPVRDSLDQCIKKGMNLPVLSILTSRGCPGRCSFCNSSTYFSLGGGKNWRSRSAKNVVDEIQLLVEKYRSDNMYWVIHIYDDNFIGPGHKGRERARDIALEMIRRGLKVPFDIFCRVDSFNDDEELLVLLKEAGMVSAFIGLESGISSTLTLYNKGTTPEQNTKAMKIMEKYNIATPASGFIMFHPYVTFDELRENARFLLSIGQATFWNLSVNLILFRGTKLVDRVVKDNLIGEMSHHWAAYQYRFLHPDVEPLAQEMNFNNHEVLVRLDSAVRYVENMLCKINEQLQDLKETLSDWEDIVRYKNRLKDQLNHIQKIGVEFFLSSIQIAENRQMHKFTGLKERYIGDIDHQIDTLNSMFVDYVAYIEKEIG